nr:hypothetical protein Iba_chr12bCG15560 [Ipomoea batatas]
MESSGRRETTSAAKENTRAFLADFMSIPRACFTFTVARGSKRRLRGWSQSGKLHGLVASEGGANKEGMTWEL